MRMPFRAFPIGQIYLALVGVVRDCSLGSRPCRSTMHDPVGTALCLDGRHIGSSGLSLIPLSSLFSFRRCTVDSAVEALRRFTFIKLLIL